MISINPNFLTPEEISTILNYVKNESQKHWSIDENNQRRVLNLNYYKSLEPKDKLILEMIIKIRIRIEQHIKQTCGLSVPIYAECASVIRWPEGYEQEPHADSEQNNPDDGEHPYPHRFYAAVCYLNDDYEGGEISFKIVDYFEPSERPDVDPDYNEAIRLKQIDVGIKPKANSIVIFPSSAPYFHTAHIIKSNVKYMIPGHWIHNNMEFHLNEMMS